MMARIGSTARIDTGREIRFTFDGATYSGCVGDTLASALLANGIRLVGRSFKYHRPRGVLTAGLEEPNALVTVLRGNTREANLPATTIELFDGLVAESQNRFPSLRFDIGSLNDLLSPFFSAGFYYKTFMGPVAGPLRGTRFWMLCEALIRRAAGLGRADHGSEMARYERMNAFCDLLVIGAGPTGLAAAKAAADAGKSVILCESDPLPGGSANWSGETIEGEPAHLWIRDLASNLQQHDKIRMLTRTTVWGAYDNGTYAALERVTDHVANLGISLPRHRHWIIRAEKTVLASGAHERPLVFPGNDRPGIMLVSAGQRYALEFGVAPGKKVTVFTNNDSAYHAAAQLYQAGVDVSAVIDLRSQIGEAARAFAENAGITIHAGHGVVRTTGRHALKTIGIAPISAESGKPTGQTQNLETDCLLVSGGWTPVINLASQWGDQPVWNDKIQSFVSQAKKDGDRHIAGAANGTFTTGECIAEGQAAGLTASGSRRKSKKTAVGTDGNVLDPTPASRISMDASGRSFVDFQHDVTVSDIRLAHREGFSSVEHLKRYTTLGMATDQGKTSNIAGLSIMAETRGLKIHEVGTTRFRPPFAPVSLGALSAERAGELSPQRLTPLHDWHVEAGARMFEVGLWYRPEIYPNAGETLLQASSREAVAVRESVGMVDVSTLGKIAVQGPDAGAFLDNVYTNMFSTLSVGRARYGLMLREDGVVLDDGTTWRLGVDDFLMTTTTANAGKVMQHLEYCRDVHWPLMEVTLTSVTDQWAGLALAGPKSREVLEACVTGAAVDNETLPFMGIVNGMIADVPVMICRLSFSGERAYEVYCGSGYAEAVWEAVHNAGQDFAIACYGMEALDILRIEKGHVTGREIDGRTTVSDLRLDWMISKKKPFVGSALMEREGMVGKNRHTLVGLVAIDHRQFHGGGHLVESAEMTEPATSLGHVSSACYSPHLKKFIGLALLDNAREHIGSRLYVSDPLRKIHVPVDVVSNHMFDPDGSRMHG